jgi:hypothetical protein
VIPHCISVIPHFKFQVYLCLDLEKIINRTRKSRKKQSAKVAKLGFQQVCYRQTRPSARSVIDKLGRRQARFPLGQLRQSMSASPVGRTQ